MNQQLTYRKANINDLKVIVLLLLEDELGQNREHLAYELDHCYLDAFYKIDIDSN